MKNFHHILIFIGSLLFSIASFSQVQKGADIVGEFDNDHSGRSVSMPDANTIAIGSPDNDGTDTKAGHARIFTWNGTSWQQKGGDIDGESLGDESGSAVSMPDPNTIVVGAPLNNGNGGDAGHVRVHSWDGTNWIQKGADLDGEAAGDLFGSSVSMPDANTVAVGAHINSANGVQAGHVRVFKWDGSSWVQKGVDIDGQPVERIGWAVSMPDANTIAIGAPEAPNGIVRIYIWNGIAWVQKGVDIVGEMPNDESGYSVSMSGANTVAIGARSNDGNGNRAGHARVFNWNGSAWVQKGGDIDGEDAGDDAGFSVSMGDNNTIAVGSVNNDGGGFNAGHARVFSWDGNNWSQTGIDIDGTAKNDDCGHSVSMPNANTVAVGAGGFDQPNGFGYGHVRIYNVGAIGIEQLGQFEKSLKVYPNPSTGVFTIEHNGNDDLSYQVMDITGKVLEQGNSTSQVFTIDLSDKETATYILKVSLKGKTTQQPITVIK